MFLPSISLREIKVIIYRNIYYFFIFIRLYYELITVDFRLKNSQINMRFLRIFISFLN